MRCATAVAAALTLTLAVAPVLPPTANAQVSCNTFVAIAISPAGPVGLGDTRTVTLSLGTEAIDGGTKVTMLPRSVGISVTTTAPPNRSTGPIVIPRIASLPLPVWLLQATSDVYPL